MTTSYHVRSRYVIFLTTRPWDLLFEMLLIHLKFTSVLKSSFVIRARYSTVHPSILIQVITTSTAMTISNEFELSASLKAGQYVPWAYHYYKRHLSKKASLAVIYGPSDKIVATVHYLHQRQRAGIFQSRGCNHPNLHRNYSTFFGPCTCIVYKTILFKVLKSKHNDPLSSQPQRWRAEELP